MSKNPSIPENPVETMPPNELHLLAHSVVAHMQFLSLHLVSMSSTRYPVFDDRAAFESPIFPSDSLQVAFNAKSRQVTVIVSLGVQAGKGKDKLAEVSAIYRLIYQVKDTFSGDMMAERASAFCHLNSLAHVWPYWRELLATTCLRMDLPPILAPLLLVGGRTVSKELDAHSGKKKEVKPKGAKTDRARN